MREPGLGVKLRAMWWGIGFGAFFYVLLLVSIGISTLNKGHYWLFGLGLLFPVLWVVGALKPAHTT